MQSQPIDFNPPTEEPPNFLLPVTRQIFSERADRFAALATGHTLADWLDFLGDITRAQHHAAQALPALALPDAETLAQAKTHGMPPIDISKRPEAWRTALRQIAAELLPLAPEAAHQTLENLIAADDAQLEALAAALIEGEIGAANAGALPFVAAALQVVFTQLASQLDTAHLQALDAPSVCPCCGSPAVGSVVRLGSAVNNLRYLHCSLCNLEWNFSRAVCTTCAKDQSVAYQLLEGGKDAVRAETCDLCKSYLKVFHQDKEPNIDPVADDLATLALDLLVDEAGYQRAGPNLLLIGAHSG